MNLLNIEWPKEPELKVSLRPCISVCGEILLGEAVLTNVSTLNKDAGSLPLKVKEEVQIWSAAHLHLSLIIKHSQSGIIPRHIVLGVQSKVCAQLSLHYILHNIKLQKISEVYRKLWQRKNLLIGRVLEENPIVEMESPQSEILLNIGCNHIHGISILLRLGALVHIYPILKHSVSKEALQFPARNGEFCLYPCLSLFGKIVLPLIVVGEVTVKERIGSYAAYKEPACKMNALLNRVERKPYISIKLKIIAVVAPYIILCNGIPFEIFSE